VPAALDFFLPPELVAREPAERRGLSRDRVRLLVLDRASLSSTHTRFDRLPELLGPGDLLVFNASRTLPAVLDARGPDDLRVEVRLTGQHLAGAWLALLRPRSPGPVISGMSLIFEGGLTATVGPPGAAVPYLWPLHFSHDGVELLDRLHRVGRPVRYEYVSSPWPLSDYQTVYAAHPGSAEMPSAGRAFTWRLLFALRRRGVGTAALVLHTGLSSYLDDVLDREHPVGEEEYRISPGAAAAVNEARDRGGRVIAVGTTVVRALETAGRNGRVRPGTGRTRLRVTAEHELRVTDGLLTGLHEPQASHLDLLTAFAPAAAIRTAYEEAVERGYLWHEFGDLNLIL
jgi:S-adenosylmethionine:tRNA ribosyltransferase-isomerase